MQVRTDNRVVVAIHDPGNGDLNAPEENVEVVLEDNCRGR